ncbi:MAG: prepilin peptidase [Nitriliruptoraceae bacterium]|nr:prepilin peptidase [Nitriliruptoraceae bacterium]
MGLLIAGAVVIGLLVGSFANVPIHRWPNGGTVMQPTRSACPACGALIAARDNIPVVSWLVLGRRCRNCAEPIAVRYTIVEAVTAALFGATAWVWGLDPLLPALLVLVWSLVVATAIDLEHRIIPNRLTLRLPFVLAPLVVFAAVMDGAWIDLRRAALAAILVPGVMFALSEVFRLVRGQVGIGMGDIKLAISLGMVVGYLGALELVVFAYATIISAVVIAVALMAVGRARLASRIPFGPYLAVGALVPILAGEPAVALVGLVLGI